MSWKKINLQKENIVVLFLATHTTDQTQPLDLTIFGIMKRFQMNYRPQLELSQTSNQILKMYQCLYQACTLLNCRASFGSIGITINCRFIVNIIYQVAGFDLTKINRIQFYQMPYINELIKYRLQLSLNQYYIFMKNQRNEGKEKNHNIPIPFCPTIRKS